MLYRGFFVFSLKMLFQDHERAVDNYLVNYVFYKRLNSDSFYYMFDV